MICLNCKKQIADDLAACPHCGKEIAHEEQTVQEIKYRRYQRWFFYVIIIVVFLGMLGLILKFYQDNAKLQTNYINVGKELKSAKEKADEAQKNLSQMQSDLTDTSGKLIQIQTDFTAKENEKKDAEAKTLELEQKMASSTEDNKKLEDEKTELANILNKFKADLGATNASVYQLMVKLGVGISVQDISKIPVADYNLSIGTDTDQDGLSNEAEKSIGTDPKIADTDKDGFGDKAELVGGFNYLGKGKMNIDKTFADKQKGKILIQKGLDSGSAWYVNPGDGKRYFLGKPAVAYQAMINLGIVK